MRIFHRLLWSFLPITMLLVLVFGWIVQNILHDNLLSSAQEEVKAVADIDRARLVDQLAYTSERLEAFNSRLLVRRLLASFPDSPLSDDAASQVQKIITESSEFISSFQRVYLLNRAGTVVASTESQSINRPFGHGVMLTKANKSPVLASFEVQNDRLVLWSAIALELDGQPVGHLVVGNNAKHVLQILADVSELGDTARSVLLTRGSENDGLAITPSHFVSKLDAFSGQQLRDLRGNIGMGVLELEDRHGELSLAVVHDIPEVGWLHITSIEKGEALAPLSELYWTLVTGGLAAMLIMFLVVAVLSRKMARPIEALAETARKIEQGDRLADFPHSDTLELNSLARMVKQLLTSLKAYQADLEGLVSKRTAELEQSNKELNASIAELRRTQQQLIESEKMASLGGLVAGVAHEVNTPLGVSMGAASHLAEQVTMVQGQFEAEQLTQDTFSSFIKTAATSSDILVQNLRRSSDLIQSFKKVAVDQSDDHVERIVLMDYVHQVLRSLAPKYKRMNLHFRVTGDSLLQAEVPPGAVAQILTNLVVNAVTHGFKEEGPGEIHITLSAENGDVTLVFEDDGKGMSAEVVARAFDPFFTTKRGQGGSGLGLHIVYNLVSRSLKGKVKLESEDGKGCRVVMVFPQRLS